MKTVEQPAFFFVESLLVFRFPAAGEDGLPDTEEAALDEEVLVLCSEERLTVP